MKLFFQELEHKDDIKSKLKPLESIYSRRIPSAPTKKVSNEYASERREVIPEGRFNMQEAMGSNENMVSDKTYAKLKK